MKIIGEICFLIKKKLKQNKKKLNKKGGGVRGSLLACFLCGKILDWFKKYYHIVLKFGIGVP